MHKLAPPSIGSDGECPLIAGVVPTDRPSSPEHAPTTRSGPWFDLGLTRRAPVRYGYADGLEESGENMRFDLYDIKTGSIYPAWGWSASCCCARGSERARPGRSPELDVGRDLDRDRIAREIAWSR
jgi:hypothetical protein